MQSNARFWEILHLEPKLKPVIYYAARCRNVPGYNRISTYRAIRETSSCLVGWDARRPELRSSEDYDVVIDIIVELFPPDDIDLYPDGNHQDAE